MMGTRDLSQHQTLSRLRLNAFGHVNHQQNQIHDLRTTDHWTSVIQSIIDSVSAFKNYTNTHQTILANKCMVWYLYCF